MNAEFNPQNTLELTNLNSVRNDYDIFELAVKIKKTGDQLKLSKKLNIRYGVLSRAVAEAKILSKFPKIRNTRSKVVPLSTLKTSKEKELFFKKYNIEKISCRKIYKLVKEWRILLEKNPQVLLTEKQHDLIIGSTLGDSNLRKTNKNCLFRTLHSPKQKEYLYWKYNVLKEFTKMPPFLSKRKLNDRIIKTFEFSTFIHNVFNFYYNLFYKNSKKSITREILDMLTPRSLAIWICDDGSFGTKQPYIILCTNSFSLEEHKIIKKYFEEVWNLSPTIGFRDKKYYYLRFKQEDTKKLIQIIKPFIIDSMKYKIGEKNERKI